MIAPKRKVDVFRSEEEGGGGKRRLSSPGPLATSEEEKGTWKGGLQSEEVGAAVDLLSTLGLSREEVFKGLLVVLRDAVVNEATKTPHEKLKTLLESSFNKVIDNPDLCAVPVAILERSTTVEEKYMRRLAASAPHGKPYVDLSLGLKQKIWEMDNDVFKQELAASITRLGNDPDSVGKVTPRLLKALPTAIFTPTTSSSDIPLVNPSYEKSRRELNVELSAICNRIGANEKLLLSTLRIVRNRFIETGSMAFCTLSLDLVFAMREGMVGSEGKQLVQRSEDVILKFALKLYELEALGKSVGAGSNSGASSVAAITTTAPAATVQICVEELRKMAETIAKEDRIDSVALLLGAIGPVTTLTLLAIKHIRDVHIKRSEEPSPTSQLVIVDTHLLNLTCLLLLGTGARRVILEKKFNMPDEDKLKYHYRMVYKLLRDDIEREASGDDAEMPDTRLHKIAKESPLVQRLLCTYALSLFKLGDVIGVCRLRQVLEYVFVGATAASRERSISEFLLHFINTDNFHMDD